MHADHRNHFVRLCVDHADVVRITVGNVNFIFPWVRRQPGWTLPHRDYRLDVQSAQVNDSNRIAFAVADIGVFAIIRYRIRRTAASTEGNSKQA